MAELTTTMQQAVDYARQHGGQLERFPGGYWCEPGRTQWTATHSTTFGTKTIEALVSRGVAHYTAWKDGKGGRFPVRMALSTPLQHPSTRPSSVEGGEQAKSLPMVPTNRMVNAAVNAWHSWKSRDSGGNVQLLGRLMWEHMADAAPEPGAWDDVSGVPGTPAPLGWLYDWTHSSALGKPDEHFTGFTTDEAYARKHDNPRPVYAAPAGGVMVSDEAQRREVWLRACGAFCAPDGTCSCAKFADDPTKCERKKEMERAYGVTVAGHPTFPQETPPIPEEPQSPTTTGGEKEHG